MKKHKKYIFMGKSTQLVYQTARPNLYGNDIHGGWPIFLNHHPSIPTISITAQPTSLRKITYSLASNIGGFGGYGYGYW